MDEDFRVRTFPTSNPALVFVVVDHRPTWRRKSGTAQNWPGGIAHMAGCLMEDLEDDLRDVAEGTLPVSFGRFTPEDERD